MEGGAFAAWKGMRLIPHKHAAAPKQIAFGTKIKVKGTGCSMIDGHEYTVVDRGGAIKVKNGVYHIDICVNRHEMSTIGRRRGKLLIYDPTIVTKTAISGGGSIADPRRAALVAEAKRHLGAKYVWGATGPSTFDCSGLTSYVYKKTLGIRLPRVSKDQGRAGKFVSRANLLPGDLIFWGNPIHHVAMYIGGGYYIHAPQPGDHVRITRLTSYTTARRFI